MLHGSWIGQGLAQFLMSRISIKKIKNMFRREKKKKKNRRRRSIAYEFFLSPKTVIISQF